MFNAKFFHMVYWCPPLFSSVSANRCWKYITTNFFIYSYNLLFVLILWFLIWHNLTIQNYWFFGFCPSSGILETRKHNVSETDPVSKTLFFFYFLQYWTMDKVQRPSNSECYTPSSEPFRIYMIVPWIGRPSCMIKCVQMVPGETGCEGVN
jgi:hypothetical protein